MYYIYYRSLKGDDRSWQTYGTKNLTARLDHLIPGNLYGIRMMVSAPGANGIASLEQEIWTIEGGKDVVAIKCPKLIPTDLRLLIII